VVIAKQTDNGYCLRFSINGHFESLGDMMIRGANVRSCNYLCFDVLGSKLCYRLLIPLHKSAAWLIFRRILPSKATFSFCWWGTSRCWGTQ
jgi:hypothetical protein